MLGFLDKKNLLSLLLIYFSIDLGNSTTPALSLVLYVGRLPLYTGTFHDGPSEVSLKNWATHQVM